jgi:hypothetical protein
VAANIIKRILSIGILVSDENRGEFLEEDSPQQEEALTLFSLLKSMMKPKTLPHVGFMIVSSAILFTFFSGNQHFQAVVFIGLSVSYLLLGVFLGERFDKILGVKSAEKQSMTKRIFSPILPPIGLGVVLILTMLVTLDSDNGVGEYLPTFLASLFVIWSVLQGRALLNWLRLSGHQVRFVPTNSIFQICIFLVVVYVVVFGYETFVLDESSVSLPTYILMFVLIGVSLCVILYSTKNEKIQADTTEQKNAYSRVIFLAMMFLTWHFFTVQRQLKDSSGSTLMYFEELFLMMFTVIMSIWALTSKSFKSHLQLVNEKNALPIGISFGFAYAGSIAVLSDLFGDVRNVLIAGHVIVAVTVLLGLRKQISRMYSSFLIRQEIQDLVHALPTEIQNEQLNQTNELMSKSNGVESSEDLTGEGVQLINDDDQDDDDDVELI